MQHSHKIANSAILSRADAPKRTFLAIKIPIEMAATLHKKAEHSLGPVDGLCWVAPQKLHITLTFLGASWPQQLTTLVDCLAQELRNCPAFNCRTGDFCYFPNARKPRVLCLKIHSEALEHLGTLCEQAAASCDFKVDSRKFRPHLTLGRFKKIPNYPPFFNLRSFCVTVNEIHLFESVQTTSGVRYKTLHVFPLRPLALSA